MPIAAQARQIDGSQLASSDEIPSIRSDGTTDARISIRPPRRGECRDAGQGARVQAEHATEQRTPWERDGDEVHAPGERRVGKCFGAGGKEHDVGRTAARRASGRLGHRGRGSVHAKHQGARLGARPGEDRAAVTGTDIGDHPVGPGDQAGDLADVHVRDAPADDLSHGRQSTLGS